MSVLTGPQLRLSPREAAILEYLLKGFSEKEIAADLGLARATVHEYVTSLYRKADVNSRAQLMAKFLQAAQGPAVG